MKGEVIGECEKLLATPDGGKTRFQIVSDLFSKEASDDPKVNRSILCLLLSLYFQDGGNKQLVDLWVKESRINRDVLYEMCDTIRTGKEIDEYQKWIETSKGMSRQESNPLIQELDKDKKSLQQSVSDLVALG
jgi:hypothetical protein